MMGKVKEAVYSTFTSFGLYDTTVRHLDIFSGSGSVGLESLSRGASHCTFVDMSSDCCATCERNVQRCGFDGWVKEGGGFGTGHSDEDEKEPQARVVCSDAYRALRHPETVGIPSNSKYDIVTLCPPYEEIVYAELLEAVANSQLVTEDTIVLVEYPVELGCLPHAIGREDGGVLVGVRNRRYGRTVSVFVCVGLMLDIVEVVIFVARQYHGDLIVIMFYCLLLLRICRSLRCTSSTPPVQGRRLRVSRRSL